MAEALGRSRAAMESLRATAGAGEAERATTALLRLREVTLEHLDHEEQELEPVHFEPEHSPELKEMGRQFAKVSPAKGGQLFAWVTDGASAEEQQAVRANVPGPVLAVLVRLFGRHYRRNVAPAWRT